MESTSLFSVSSTPYRLIMRIKLLDFTERLIKLKSPLRVGKTVITKTKTLDVRVLVNDKVVISPLSQFPLFYEQQNLNQFLSIDYIFDLKTLTLDHTIPTNILFMIELAVIQYDLKYGDNIFSTFNKSCTININDLYIQDQDLALIKSDIVKVKIGRNEIEKDRETIISLIAKGKTLRLDGNRMMTPKTLSEMLAGVDLKNIEYIEEPFKETSSWEEFSLKDEIPLALDESLPHYIAASLPTNTAAFIIKPTLIFGIFKTLEIIKSQKFQHIKKVISSSFEEEFTINVLAHLASKNCDLFPHGLGTLNHLCLETKKITQIGTKLHAFPISDYPLQ